jgi:hypothetical protein
MVLKRRYVDIIAVILAMACGLAALFLDVPLTYVVSANTERVVVRGIGLTGSNWYLDDAEIMTGCETDWHKFSGTIHVHASTNIAIERISEGPLRISVLDRNNQQDKAVAELEDFANEANMLATGCLYATIEDLGNRSRNGETVVLPVNGYVETGRETRHETMEYTPLLRSGKVQLIGRTLFGDSVYDAGTITLGIGDLFLVAKPQAGSGLVVADQQPGLTSVAYVVGDRAYVHRFGTEGYKVSSSLWVRIERDPVIGTLAAAAVFILGLLASWRRWLGKK